MLTPNHNDGRGFISIIFNFPSLGSLLNSAAPIPLNPILLKNFSLMSFSSLFSALQTRDAEPKPGGYCLNLRAVKAW